MDKLKGMSDNLEVTDEDLEEFELPEGIQPILAEEPLESQDTKNGINLFWAPEPFNKRTGKMRRNYDIPLVQGWFKERCP
jgi:pre-mRNA-processing factor 8